VLGVEKSSTGRVGWDRGDDSKDRMVTFKHYHELRNFMHSHPHCAASKGIFVDMRVCLRKCTTVVLGWFFPRRGGAELLALLDDGVQRQGASVVCIIGSNISGWMAGGGHKVRPAKRHYLYLYNYLPWVAAIDTT